MAEWHGYVRHYRKIKRPRSPAMFVRTIVDMAAASADQQRRRSGRSHPTPRAKRKTSTVGRASARWFV